MIKRGLCILALAGASPALAQPGARLTDEQAAIAYHQCLAHAAARLSRQELGEDAIFPQARRQCIPTRVRAQTAAANVVSAGEALDRIDAEARQSFPSRTRRVREMRRRFEAGASASPAAGTPR